MPTLSPLKQKLLAYLSENTEALNETALVQMIAETFIHLAISITDTMRAGIKAVTIPGPNPFSLDVHLCSVVVGGSTDFQQGCVNWAFCCYCYTLQNIMCFVVEIIRTPGLQ